MLTLVLPRLVAGRDFADDLVDRLVDHLGENLQGTTVAVDGRGLASGTSSFADQVVRRVLVDGGAEQLVLLGAPSDFAAYVTRSAQDRGVVGRLRLSSHAHAAAASA